MAPAFEIGSTTASVVGTLSRSDMRPWPGRVVSACTAARPSRSAAWYERPQPNTFPATLRLSMSGLGSRLSARVSTSQPNRKMAVAVGPIVASNIDTPPTSETAIWLWFG